jgi:ribosomal protein S4
VTLTDKIKKLALIVNSLAEPGRSTPPFLQFDDEKMAVTFVSRPAREDVLLDVKETAIIEWYNRMS